MASLMILFAAGDSIYKLAPAVNEVKTLGEKFELTLNSNRI